MKPYIEPLLSNSKQALFTAIEIQNKPVFPHSYQIYTTSIINAGELLLKAYLAEYVDEVKLNNVVGTSKRFDECLTCVFSHLGNDFLLKQESIDWLKETCTSTKGEMI